MADDGQVGRLSPIQLATLFQTMQGPAEWRRQAGVKTAGAHFGGGHVAVTGLLDLTRLAAAWQQVVHDQPLLRAGYDASVIERPVQRVYREAEAPVEVLDWRAFGEQRRRDELAGLRVQESDRGFDLDRPPLARLTVVRAGAAECWLVITAHAVILDDLSVWLLFDQLLRCYDGAAPRPPEAGAPESYLEYASSIRSQGIGAAQRFWTAELTGFRAPVQIVKDVHDPGFRDLTASREAQPLPAGAGLSDALTRLRATCGARVDSALYAAWALALSRYSGETDVVIGADLRGREHRPGLGQVIGPFRNAVPLRVRVSERETAGDLLRQAERVRLSVTGHEYVPGPLIREWAGGGPDRILHTHGFYTHLVTIRPAPSRLYQPAGLTARPLTVAPRRAESLALTAEFTGTRLAGEVIYCTTLAGEPAARQLGRHLVNLILGLAASPGARLHRISMLGESGRLHSVPDRAARRQPECRIEDLILPWATARPDAPAVRELAGDGRILTYGELVRQAGWWAAALHSRGIGPGDTVGVHMRRTADLVAALVGVFLSGAAYVPLDPDYPAARLAMMAADAGLRAVLDDTGGPPLRGDLVTPPRQPGSPPAVLQTGGGPGELAYILYTSGSTGRPKGVEICHRNTVNLLRWAAGTLGSGLAAFLATTSVNFDCSILELFGTLSAGGTVLLGDGPLSAARLRAAAGATIVNAVPSVMANALRDGELPSSVRIVILGGEPPWPALIERIRAGGQVRRILNLYGPAETTSYSTIAEVGSALGHPPSVGTPIWGTRVYVLDRYQNPVPAGVAGELYIGGAGVARGYHGLPGLTSERFVADPFADDPGGRLYRTGDLVRHGPDGGLLFLGRGDSQVKIHGVRVETGEVEHALTTVSGVGEAAVVAAEGPDGQRSLMAWVTPDGTASPLVPEQVRSGLHRLLPTAMVPARIMVAGELPRLPNGKVDSAALHAAAAAPCGAGPLVAPRGPVEKWLADLWSELLDLGQVSVADDFFDLGGDSFVAMRMIGRAQEEGFPLEPADIYTAGTITSLAALVAARSGP